MVWGRWVAASGRQMQLMSLVTRAASTTSDIAAHVLTYQCAAALGQAEVEDARRVAQTASSQASRLREEVGGAWT